MNALNFKNRLGIALCGFFGAATLSSLYVVCNIIFLTYNRTVAFVLLFIVNIICGISLFYAAKSKDNFNFNIGRIAAFILVAMYFIFAINNITFNFGFPLFKFLGTTAGVILDSIIFILLATFLFSSKIWMPIKIVGSIEYLISIISCIIFIELNNAFEVANNTYDYTLYDSLVSSEDLCSYIILLINISSLILTIVWMNQRSIAPSASTHKLNLI